MLLVQKYLENHTFGELALEHGVYASFSKSSHKWSLNYDQIEAKESNPLAQECRGLVLACEDGRTLIPAIVGGKQNYDHISPGKTTILAYPMKRFFNYGQGCAAQVNWSDPNLSVLEKLDGTLCILYFDKFTEEWCVATRSVPEADLLMDNGLYTFRTLFEKALMETSGLTLAQLSSCIDRDLTYCFELTTPYNRIVVDYKNCAVTLLAVRNLLDLKEDDPKECIMVRRGHVPAVIGHTYSSTEDLLNWVSSLNPIEHEGVVVRDSNFNRIKVKNAAYVAYNKLHDRLGSSERNCMEFVLLEKDDDVAPFLAPEIGENMAKLKAGFVKAIHQHDGWYQGLRVMQKAAQSSDKKTFAIGVQTLAKEHPQKIWTAPFFAIYDGRASSMKDFIQKNRKDGTWGDSFLDRILEISKSHSV